MAKTMLAIGKVDADGSTIIDTGESVPVPNDFAGMDAYLRAMEAEGAQMDWAEFDRMVDEPGYGETSHAI